MDKFRIDSHKLLYHVPRVHDWLQGKLVFPIYMEISPAGACNHRCTYCGLDFMGYQVRYLDVTVLKERLSEMGKLGLKSVMYAGEGEPFLHKQRTEIIRHTKEAGIDVAITTNGVLLQESLAEQILGHVEWMKISINGATRETYAGIHRTKANDFDMVLKNLSQAVKLKQKMGYTCTLGMQLLLLPENQHEAMLLAKIARDIGMDYLVIKPYSQHPQSHTDRYKDVRYEEYFHLAEELDKYNSEDFQAIFRANAMKKWDRGGRNYTCCLALPFWSYMDAGGNIWGCSMYLGDKRFYYGNIYEKSFQEIWEGEQRKQSLRWVEEQLDIKECRVNCRMDEINRYLRELKNPPAHVNFI
ncbi:MAG: radical SAM protein [bacterium]|nr:radical SAM protein [bacterium]